jgi:hypothetical protein
MLIWGTASSTIAMTGTRMIRVISVEKKPTSFTPRMLSQPQPQMTARQIGTCIQGLGASMRPNMTEAPIRYSANSAGYSAASSAQEIHSR